LFEVVSHGHIQYSFFFFFFFFCLDGFTFWPVPTINSEFKDIMDGWLDYLDGDLLVAKPLLTQENTNTEKLRHPRISWDSNS
jgi:hypothetical protein